MKPLSIAIIIGIMLALFAMLVMSTPAFADSGGHEWVKHHKDKHENECPTPPPPEPDPKPQGKSGGEYVPDRPTDGKVDNNPAGAFFLVFLFFAL